MKIEDLEKYLSRKDVSLKVRIQTLVQSGLPPNLFVSFGETLLGEVSSEEQNSCKKEISYLNCLMVVRQRLFGLN